MKNCVILCVLILLTSPVFSSLLTDRGSFIELLNHLGSDDQFGSFLDSTVQRHHTQISRGRRRVVSDDDCDQVMDEDDVIEKTCGVHRFNVLQQLFQLLQEAANRNGDMNTNIMRMNLTMIGDPSNLGAVEGQRQVFHLQRNYLYGPNGTCADPKPKSIAQTSNVLTTALFHSHDLFEAVYDTLWKNLETIQNGLSKSVTNVTNKYINISMDFFEEMNKVVQDIHRDATMLNTGIQSVVNKILANGTMVFNQGFRRTLHQMNRTQSMGDRAMKTIDTSMEKMMDFFERLTDQFSGIDDTVADIITDLADKTNPMIGFNPTNLGTQTWGVHANHANNTVNDFESATLDSINSTFDSVSSVATSAGSSVARNVQATSDSIDDTNETILTKTSILGNAFTQKIDYATGNVTKLVRDAQTASTDAKGMVVQVNLSIGDHKKALKAISDSLEGVSGEGAGTIRKQIANILSSGGQISDSQLSSIVTSLSNLNSNILGAVADAKAKQDAAATASQNSVAKGASEKAGQSGDFISSINAERLLSNQVVSSSGNVLQSQVMSKLGSLRTVADSSSASLTDLAAKFSSSLGDTTVSTNSAISGSSNELGNMINVQSLQSSEMFSNINALVSGNASAINTQAVRSEADLKQTSSNLNSILDSVGLLSTKSAALDKSDNLVGLSNSVARSDDQIGSSFSQQLQDVLKSAGLDVSKQEESLANGLSSHSNDAANAVSSLQSSGDGVESQSVKTMSDSQNFNFGLQDQLGSIDAGVTGALAVSINNMNVSQSKITTGLSQAMNDGTYAVNAVGIENMKGVMQTNSTTQQETSEKIVKILKNFKSHMDHVLKKAYLSPSGGSVSKNPKIQALSLDLKALLEKLDSSFGGPDLKEVETDFERNSGYDDDQLLRVDFNSLKNRMVANISSLNLRVNQTVGQLPATFLGNLGKFLTDVIANEYSSVGGNLSSKTNWLFDNVVSSDGSAVSSSGKFLNQLSSASDNWDSRLSQNRDAASATNRNQISTLVNLTDQASGLASMISNTRPNSVNNRGNLNKAENDIHNMVAGIMSSVSATNSTLTRSSASNAAQSDFNTQMGSSRTGRLIQDMRSGVNGTTGTVGDTNSAILANTGEQSMNVDNLDKSLAAYANERAAKISHAISQLGTMDSSVQQNISSNKASVEMNLLLAKRAVRDLLDSWTGYADYEISKFRKMQNVDETYVETTGNFLDSKTTQSQHELLGSQSQMSLTDSDTLNAVSDYMEFNKASSDEISTLFRIVPLLNSTAENSIAQIGESAVSFDRADFNVDKTERQSSIEAIAKFEQGLDQHAQMALATTTR